MFGVGRNMLSFLTSIIAYESYSIFRSGNPIQSVNMALHPVIMIYNLFCRQSFGQMKLLIFLDHIMMMSITQ
jgi:hypothetical protein